MSSYLINLAKKHGHDLIALKEQHFSHYGLTGFRHIRLYFTGEKFELTTDPDYLEYYISNGYHEIAAWDRSAHDYPEGYFLWDAFKIDNKIYDQIMRDVVNNFNGGRGLTITKKSEFWVDRYDFSTSIYNNSNEFLIKNIDLFEKFIANYNQQAKAILNNAHEQKQIVLFNKTPLLTDLDPLLPSNIIKVFDTNNNQSLSKRELETIYWLINGKTAHEISILLAISSRTVEKFIISIKNKLKCYTLFQLGIEVEKIGLTKLLKYLSQL